MGRSRRGPLALVALSLGVLVAAPASATISRALSLDELTRSARHVVLVTCVEGTSRRDGARRIVTDYTLRVDEVVRGPASSGDTLVMRSLGGVLGDLGMRVEGEPRLEPGARYLVFLRVLSDGRTLRPVGMSQGVMPVREEAGQLVVSPGGAELALVQRVRGGQLAPAPAALIHPEPFDAVRARIESSPSGALAP